MTFTYLCGYKFFLKLLGKVTFHVRIVVVARSVSALVVAKYLAYVLAVVLGFLLGTIVDEIVKFGVVLFISIVNATWIEKKITSRRHSLLYKAIKK